MLKWKTMTKATWEHRVYLFYPFTSLSIPRRSQDRNSEQELGDRSWCRGHWGVLFRGLFLISCSFWLLVESRTISIGVAPTTIDHSHLNHQLWKWLQDLSTAQSMEIFLIWVSLLSDDFCWWETKVKLSTHVIVLVFQSMTYNIICERHFHFYTDCIIYINYGRIQSFFTHTHKTIL